MLTVKDLIQSPISSSLDGKHWEPALADCAFSFWYRFRDAMEVLHGRAHAIRQTTKEDLKELNHG